MRTPPFGHLIIVAQTKNSAGHFQPLEYNQLITDNTRAALQSFGSKTD